MKSLFGRVGRLNFLSDFADFLGFVVWAVQNIFSLRRVKVDLLLTKYSNGFWLRRGDDGMILYLYALLGHDFFLIDDSIDLSW